MPDLDRNIHFSGDDDVGGEDLGRAEVANFSSAVDTALRDSFEWAGKAIGAVGLTLSPDNDRVTSGVFVTRGDTELEEFRSTCDQIWQDGPANILLAIRVSSLNPFTFSSGGLWSDFIPGSRFVHGFYDKSRDNAAILGTPTDTGVGEFCLRIVCQPSSQSSGRRGVICKYTVLLFPESADELSSLPESRFAGFPGFKIGEGYFPLGPAPRSRWQCPIVPLIRPGTPFLENDNAPSSARLRFAVAAVMRKAGQPDIPRSCTSLRNKWERLRSNPKEISEKAPATTWPVHQDEENSVGKSILFRLYSLN
jgi:hypothetical protein